MNYLLYLQPPRIRQAVRIGLLASLLLAVCAAAGCTTGDLKRPARHTLLKVWYSTGGSAPVVTELTVTDNDYLNLLTTQWRTHTRHVGALDTERIRLLLATPEMQAALARADDAGRGTPRGEEQLLVTVGRKEYRFPVRTLPERIRMLMEAVDDLFSRRFQNSYSLRIPH
jgi:hypothetical protein